MKTIVRKSEDRGHSDFGWLKAKSTFSFANYFDPNWVQFRSLRVMQEDQIDPSSGFDWHPHRDMEIVTVPLSGTLQHRDNMGHESVIGHGHVQRMTAGTGVVHSEFNASDSETCHLHQIWILPEQNGLTPSYEETFFSEEERAGTLRLIVSPDGRDGSITIHQDVSIYFGNLAANDNFEFDTTESRHAWVQAPHGQVSVNGVELNAGDGVAISEVDKLHIVALDDSEVLLFDLA